MDEIESRLRNREPLISENLPVQKYAQDPPSEVISDPLNDFDSEPYEEGDEAHKQLRSHQVICCFFLKFL